MIGTGFKTTLLSVTHRYLPLLIVKIMIALANTVANAFALIYLLRNGYSPADCAIFMGIIGFASAGIIAMISRTIVKHFHIAMQTALAVLCGYYISFIFLDDALLLIVPPLLFSVYLALFWIPYNSLVLHITSPKKRGTAVGVYFLIFPFIGVLGPSIGGIVIHSIGYDFLFLTAICILIADMLLIRIFKVTRELRERIIIPELLRYVKVKLEGFPQLDLDLRGVGRPLSASLISEGIEEGVILVYAPVMIFLLTDSELSSGGALSLFAFAGAIMTVILGYLTDRIGRRGTILRASAIGAAIVVFHLALLNDLASFVTLMSIAYLSMAIIPSFLFIEVGERLESERKRGVAIREFMINLGTGVGAAMVFLILLAGIDISLTILLAAPAFAVLAFTKMK
ncbi:MAG TPA: MFS transporter [Euryarchaeota archaeon]|nr:MFS transporter [Euryarchaeota archaeon]